MCSLANSGDPDKMPHNYVAFSSGSTLIVMNKKI